MTYKNITLAGGCFWGMEELFRNISGVISTRVGYTGGLTKNPVYKDICTGKTGHAEAIEVTYDPEQTAIRPILQFFFQIHDPTIKDRQGNDRGTQYRSAIFYADEDQHREALSLIHDIEQSNKWPGPIVTEVKALDVFYPAEDHHQDYLQKNPGGYTCHWIRPDWITE